MSSSALNSIAQAMVAPNKGILAADESTPTIAKRFKDIDTESTEANRQGYRNMLFTSPGISDYISGVILFDETIRQKNSEGIPFPEYLTSIGIVPGIKVDKGAKELAGCQGEKITEGLDGLRERLNEYHTLGALLQNGGQSLPLAMEFPAIPVSVLMHMPWPDMLHLPKNQVWCR